LNGSAGEIAGGDQKKDRGKKFGGQACWGTVHCGRFIAGRMP
jgi:hypothetical protein